MSPQPAQIAHYRIVSKLGEGGMGQVYRARDERLNRDVAIKVLPPALAGDAQYIARFEREAQTLAALNHPNIAAIYGIESGAIVMELVEGEMLPCPAPLDAAIEYARQIAAGLEAAHEKGIVHRDLKPANIRITRDGRVKLLDFGLAKSGGETTAAASASISPTMSLAMTQAGMILGTAAYMSPEQARGKPVDKRADIWAFGVVLYEILTGRQLFGGGETVTDTLASVVKDAPDLNALPAETPPHIRRLLERCLRKDPAKRLRDIGEARIALDEAPDITPPLVMMRRPNRLAWAIVAALAIAGGAGWWRATRPAPLRPLLGLNVEISDLPISANNAGSMLALSRDGLRIAVVARKDKPQLYTRMLNQNQLAVLAGTEGAHTPFFSPDGRWIGFGAGGKLKKVSVDGGAPTTLADAPALRGASWGDDGNIVYAPVLAGSLWRVSANGGAAAELTKLGPGERTHRWPEVLPGSRAVLFTSHMGSNVYDDANIDVISLKDGQRRTVRKGGFSPHYALLPDGSERLLYVRQTTLFSGKFDSGALTAAGDFVPVLEDVHSYPAAGASVALSAAGTMVYGRGIALGGTSKIFWVEPSGRKDPIYAPAGTYFNPRFSPDGKRIAFTVVAGARYDLWVEDIARGAASRISFLEGSNADPVWTPDGKHLVFRSSGHPKAGIYWLRSDGGGEPHRLLEGLANPNSISSDGKRLAFVKLSSTGSPDIFTATLTGDPENPTLGEPEAFLATGAAEVFPAFSPDGRWMAYESNESGRAEVYVRPFPGPGARWQISTAGGSLPIWSHTGRELFYRSEDERIMTVSYTTQANSFVAGVPRPWSDVTVPLLGGMYASDVAPDGKRLAVAMPSADEGQRPPTHVVFLLNFFDEMVRLGAK